jgi:hypothetical protein
VQLRILIKDLGGLKARSSQVALVLACAGSGDSGLASQ